MLVALKDGDCYLWRVTEYERTRMQTDYGMKAVEVNIIYHFSVDGNGWFCSCVNHLGTENS